MHFPNLLKQGTFLVISGCHDTIPQTKWLQQQRFIFYSSGSLKSKIRASAGLVSDETCLLGLQTAAFGCVSHGVCGDEGERGSETERETKEHVHALLSLLLLGSCWVWILLD